MLVNSIINFTSPDLAKGIKIPAPASGRLLNITEIDGPFCHWNLVGQGVTIRLEKGGLYSPINGTVVSINPSKGQLILQAANKLKFLLQLPLAYQKLNGLGINLKVKETEKIAQGQPLADIDLYKLNNLLSETLVYFLLIDSQVFRSIDVQHTHVTAVQDTIFSLIPKQKNKK